MQHARCSLRRHAHKNQNQQNLGLYHLILRKYLNEFLMAPPNKQENTLSPLLFANQIRSFHTRFANGLARAFKIRKAVSKTLLCLPVRQQLIPEQKKFVFRTQLGFISLESDTLGVIHWENAFMNIPFFLLSLLFHYSMETGDLSLSHLFQPSLPGLGVLEELKHEC